MLHAVLRQGMLSAKCGVSLLPTRTAAATVAMATKRKAVSIGTHSGTFHCDEALGCWMLKQTERFAGDHGYRSAAKQQLHTQPRTLWK
jgi:hypothetical protein